MFSPLSVSFFVLVSTSIANWFRSFLATHKLHSGTNIHKFVESSVYCWTDKTVKKRKKRVKANNVINNLCDICLYAFVQPFAKRKDDQLNLHGNWVKNQKEPKKNSTEMKNK